MRIRPTPFLLPAAAALLAVWVAGCGGAPSSASADGRDGAEREASLGTLVRIQPAELREMRQTVEVTGSLATLDDVTLSPKLSARLTAVYFREGDHVGAGQAVARQDTKDLNTQRAQAEAGLASARSQLLQAQTDAASSPVQTSASIEAARAGAAAARANLAKLQEGAREQEIAQAAQAVEVARTRLELAQSNFDRYSKLFENGAISEQQLDGARTELNAARAQFDSAQEALSLIKEGPRAEDIEAARQALRQAEEQLILAQSGAAMDEIKRERVTAARAAVRQAEAAVQLVRQQIADAVIYSPINGQVEERFAHAGQMVMPGTPIVRVVGLGNVYFEGDVSEAEIRYVGMGQPVSVIIDAYPDRAFRGRVAAIKPVADSQARLFTVRIALDDAGGLLRPGMFARGRIEVRVVESAVVVPKEAVLQRQGKPTVYVVSKGVAQERDVTLGLSNRLHIQVIGVEPGEQVVVKGADILTDGAKVQIERRRENAEAANPPGGGAPL